MYMSLVTTIYTYQGRKDLNNNCFFFSTEGELSPLLIKLLGKNLIIECARINCFFVAGGKHRNLKTFKNTLINFGFNVDNAILIDKDHPLYNPMFQDEEFVRRSVKEFKCNMFDLNSLLLATNKDLYIFLVQLVAKDYDCSVSYATDLVKVVNAKFNTTYEYHELRTILNAMIICYLDRYDWYKDTYIYNEDAV